MLVLTRCPEQIIRIGESISVRVLDVKGNQVRLGIDAPRNVIVDREEIYQLRKARAVEQDW
jgi:carbon storage regulator